MNYMSPPKPEDFTLLLNVFREGLIRGLISAQEIVSWADHIILSTEEPDYFFIELSLTNEKNELIEIIGKYVTEAESPICPRVLLGRLYGKLLNEPALNGEPAAKLLGTFNSFDTLSGFELNSIYTLEEYDIYYSPDLTKLQVDLIDFLSTYEPFNLENHADWSEINVQVEAVLERKEAEAEVIAASFRKAWEKNRRKLKVINWLRRPFW